MIPTKTPRVLQLKDLGGRSKSSRDRRLNAKTGNRSFGKKRVGCAWASKALMDGGSIERRGNKFGSHIKRFRLMDTATRQNGRMATK